MAEALEWLPRMASALASGALGWCAARELTRVAAPQTECAWLEAVRGKTQRELEALVADKSPGDAPDAPGTDTARRHVLRFEVAADTFATFREAMQHLERAAGSRLDHDALLLALARHALGGPTGDARSSYQIALRHLGFRESDVRAVLAELRADLVLADATAECLLREALCRIQPRTK